MSNEEIIALISNQLEEIHLGLCRLIVTMECLADSRTLEASDEDEASMVLPLLSDVGRTYIDQLEDLMLLVDRSKPAA